MNGVVNFFSKIRNGDEATKKKWLWILTPMIMIVVIAGWLLYISNSVVNLDQENNLANSKQEQNKTSFLATVGKDVSILISKVKKVITKSKSIVVEGNKFNFTLDNLEPIKSQGFPK